MPCRPTLMACAAAVLVLAYEPAWAHAILVECQPAIGGTVEAGHLVMRLRYNSRIDPGRSRLTLTRPDGSTAVLPSAGAPAADALTAVVDLRPGAYSLRWQVLAIDGHITRGDVPFTVAPAKVAP